MAQGYVYSGSPASMAARTGTPTAPQLPAAGIRYYTTLAQAKQALAQPTDIMGQGIRFAAGKGYYLGADPKGSAAGTTPPVTTGPSGDTATATAAIQAILKPVIDEINQSAATRAQQGQSLITGYTNNALDKLNSLDFGAPYKAAEGDQNAVNTALLARLGNQGSALQNQLQGELGTSVGAPAAGAAVDRVGADTTGAQNAGLAKGDATLSQLISQGAAAKDYGTKLPGIETLAGLQDSTKLQGAINTGTQNQLAAIESRMPSMVQGELSALANSRTQQAKMAEAAAIAQGNWKKAEDIAAANNATRTAIADANNTTRTNIADANNTTKSSIAAANAAARTAAANAKTAAANAKAGKATVAQVQSFLNKLPTYQTNTVTNSDGSKTTNRVQSGQTMTYMTAYKWLRSHGVDDPTARTDLAGIYKRGENGRAWLTNEEQAVLKQAQSHTAGPGVNLTTVRAVKINGQTAAFLTPDQVQWLKAANMLPPGEAGTLPNSNTQVYWIKPTN